jgi:hypothetical protein
VDHSVERVAHSTWRLKKIVVRLYYSTDCTIVSDKKRAIACRSFSRMNIDGAFA